jgi:hypothetical protein
LWQQPADTSALDAAGPLQQAGADGFGPELPGSARTVRFVFTPTSGDACCVAVDPGTIPVDPDLQQRVLVLAGLPVGAGSLTIAAFPTDFAPAPAGVSAACVTRPAEAGQPCDRIRTQTPSFASDPHAVSIRLGIDSDAGDVLIRAFPFIVPGTLNPIVGEEVPNPVAVGFTVADAVQGIDPSSIRLELASNGAPISGQPLQLDPCDDAGETPCSAGGDLQVSGFAVTRPAQQVPLGGAQVQIEAENLASPPQDLELTYPFTVGGVPRTATATATVRPTQAVTRTPTALRTPTSPTTRTATATASRTPSPTRRATATVARTPTRSHTPTASPEPSPAIIFIGVSPLTVSARPDFLATADFNLDGNADLVVISPLSSEMNVLRGTTEAPSRFSPVTVFQFGERLRKPVVGDFNDDGDVDVVVPDPGSPGVWTALGNGDGTVAMPSLLPVGNSPFAVAVADFDGRPGDDLAVADRQGNSVTLRLSNGTDPLEFSFGRELFSGSNPEEVIALDLNRDGHMDIATLNLGGEPTIGVLLWEGVDGNGSPVFASVVTYDAGQRPEGLSAIDVDGDDDEDIVLLNRPSGNPNHDLFVYLSPGNGSLEALPPLQVGCPFVTAGSCPSRGFAAGDFEQDGDIDLAVAFVDPRGLSSDGVRVLEGRGDGTFGGGPFFAVAKDVVAISAGDYTGDGPIDLAVTNSSELTVQALVNVSILASGGN